MNKDLTDNSRQTWIDVLRALGLIFVVWGHIVQPEEARYCYDFISFVRKCVCSFHMPLFFFISGMCFNHSKYCQRDYRSFLQMKFKSLLLPGYIFSVFKIAYAIIIGKVELETYLSSLEFIKSVFWFNDGEYTYWYIGALFFLECLMYWLLQKEQKFIVAFLTVSFGIMTIYQLWHFGLPFGISSAIIGAPFFFVGNIYRKNQEKLKNSQMFFWSMFIAFILVNYFDQEYTVGLWIGIIANPFTFLIKASAGIIIILFAAMKIDRSFNNSVLRSLVNAGKNSLYVYILQEYLIDIYRNIRGMEMIYSKGISDIINVVVSIVIVVVIGCTAEIIRKYWKKIFRLFYRSRYAV